MGVGFVDIATVDEDEVRLRKSGSCAISFNFVPEHYGNISAVQTLAENTSKKGSFFSFSFVFLRAPSSWEASEMCFFQLGTCYTRTENRGSKPQSRALFVISKKKLACLPRRARTKNPDMTPETRLR